MHSANQVANRLLELADEAGRQLTPLQLIKLVYLCQGWMLGLRGRSLFRNSIEAWAYGPVIPELYQAVRKYRDQPVTELIPEDPAKFDDDEDDIIKQTFEQYGKFPGTALSTLTHREGSPWSITHKELGRNSTISNDLIQGHFHGLAQER